MVAFFLVTGFVVLFVLYISVQMSRPMAPQDLGRTPDARLDSEIARIRQWQARYRDGTDAFRAQADRLGTPALNQAYLDRLEAERARRDAARS